MSIIQITLTSGWVIAIPIVAFAGLTNTVYIISITYLVSALPIVPLRVKGDRDLRNAETNNKNSMFNTFREGIMPIWRNKVVRSVTIMDMFESFANIVWVPTFLLSFTIEVLNSNEQWWGFQGSAYFLGSIICGLLAAKYSEQIRAAGGKVIIISSFAVAIITFAYGINTILIMAVFISFLDGPPYQVRNIVQESLLQESTEEGVLGRVFAARRIILQTIYAVALLLGSFLADQVGVQTTYILAGIIYIIVALYALISPTIRSFNMDTSLTVEKEVVNHE